MAMYSHTHTQTDEQTDKRGGKRKEDKGLLLLVQVSHIFLLSDLPRNASNKMLRRSMRAWFSQIQKREPDVPVMVGAYTLPMGKLGGQHAKLSAIDLGEKAAKELLSQSSLDPLLLEESLMGNVVSAGLGQNPARQVICCYCHYFFFLGGVKNKEREL